MIATLALAVLLPCSVARAGPATESPLNCLTLFPTPDLAAASGTIELLPVSSPFGVAVTVDGRPRHRLSAVIAGLPAPRTLGDYAVYVAWASTLSLDSVVNLGPVRNGRVDLGELDYVQFRILISAERSVAGRERRGRLVLRGTSPSARLLAHRDLMQPSAMGAQLDSTAAPLSMAGMHMQHAIRGDSERWSMPPLSPRLVAMPGMASLTPRTAPFLPAADAIPAPNRPPRSASVRANNGDTLLLEAASISRTIGGTTVAMYGFNGALPGPLIETTQGATFVVRYRNALDLPGSIHWHGVRLDNRFDGAVGLTQDAVPQGESLGYVLHFPDPGIYWYHPHVREDVQQALGLYGNILVRSPDPNYYSPVNHEVFLPIADVLVGADGLAPFGADAPTHALMGRFGNVFLVNGETAYTLDVKRGDIVRFFLTNVSAARIYNLSFSSGRMKVVASDGGKFEREAWVSSVVIGPAERYVVEVEFPRTGAVALLNRVQALDHMIGSYSPEVDTLGLVRVAAEPATPSYSGQFETLRRNADVATQLAPFRRYFDKPVDHDLVLTLRTRDLPAAIANMLLGINADIEWNDGMPMMNWATTSHEVTWVLRDPATGKENMDIDWRFRRGAVVKLRIFNDPSSSHAMAHPIHLHGQRFLVLTRDGVRSENLVWKDTAVVPAGQSVELLADMSNPGRWMIHCHIAEHLSAGMMASFTVQ